MFVNQSLPFAASASAIEEVVIGVDVDVGAAIGSGDGDGILVGMALGRCHRLCDAKLAGQLKTLLHSEHLLHR